MHPCDRNGDIDDSDDCDDVDNDYDYDNRNDDDDYAGVCLRHRVLRGLGIHSCRTMTRMMIMMIVLMMITMMMMMMMQVSVCDTEFCAGAEYILVVHFEANPLPTLVSIMMNLV